MDGCTTRIMNFGINCGLGLVLIAGSYMLIKQNPAGIPTLILFVILIAVRSLAQIKTQGQVNNYSFNSTPPLVLILGVPVIFLVLLITLFAIAKET